uniref:Integrase_H2C2 domain-containing protein n=1 Tax=Loa loa TaxID=7209 RepID=A0A1I7VUX5_LOALO
MENQETFHMRMANPCEGNTTYRNGPITTHKIHVFSYASSVAYAASVYVIQENEASLIFVKSRIAPIKVDVATRGLSPLRLTKGESDWPHLVSNIGEDYNESENEEQNQKIAAHITINKAFKLIDATRLKLDEQSLHPIYLPRHNRITEIFIQQHEEMFHPGTAHTISNLRKRFWIPKRRTEAKRLPTMPNYPATRVRRVRAFARVGLDYLGPVSIKTETGVTKRWVALFTCFTTRAVHLELAAHRQKVS